jgi:hypothetical protein
MAIDSERKRKSAAWLGQVFSPPTVVPDGSLAQVDRQTIAWGYYGITSTVVTPVTVTGAMRALEGYMARVAEGYEARIIEGYALRVVEHS